MEGFAHVGYMNMMFGSRKDAAEYYDRYNQDMRRLNAHGGWISDWHPVTKLRYRVREEDSEVLTVPPFNPEDAPEVVVTPLMTTRTWPTRATIFRRAPVRTN